MKKVKFIRISIIVSLIVLLCNQGFSQSILDNTQLRFFTHSEFSSSLDSAKKRTSVVEVGDIDMLVTAQVTDKLSVLGEIIFTIDDGLEIDRMMLKYQFNDYFHLTLGKQYSPIGLWNNTFYHQARVLTPTIDHPVIIADADDFGVLENKDVGVQAGGDNISDVRFGYRLFLGSGHRGDFGNEPRLGKVTYNLFIEPIDNFRFCVSGENERLAAGSNTSRGVLVEDNTINLMNGSVMYMGGTSNFEMAAEYFLVTSRSATNGRKSFNGFFAYSGYKFNKVVPYVMYNKIDYQPGQEVYTRNNFKSWTLGVRYKLASLSVLKLETQFLEAEDFKKLNRLELMWAVGF